MRTVLLESTEEACTERFTKSLETLRTGNVALFRPESGMPVEQGLCHGWRTTVHVPEDYQGGEKPPPISVKRPNMEEIESHFASMTGELPPFVPAAAPAMPATPRPAPEPATPERIISIKQLRNPFETPKHAAPAASAPRAAPEDELIRDLRLVDEGIRNTELALVLLKKHRTALFERITSGTVDATDVLRNAMDALGRLT